MNVGEDVDLVWRLAGEGWLVRYDPAATVRHEHRSSTKAWAARKAFYGTGADLLAARHGRNVAPVLSPLSTMVVAGLLTQKRWSAALAAGAVVYMAVYMTARLAWKLKGSERPLLLSAELAGQGILNALAQTMALVLRHWWPVAAVLAVFSRRARRVVLAAAVSDAVVEYARLGPQLPDAVFMLARRIDDLAYGADPRSCPAELALS
jgi:hypothetical protein